MEKTVVIDSKLFDSMVVASKLVDAKPVASKLVESKADNSKSVDSNDVSSKRCASVLDADSATDDVGALVAAADSMQIPPKWDPYEEVPYVRPSNPYDTYIT